MTKVFFEYTQDELDAQYNPRQNTDFSSFGERWSKDSAAIRNSSSAALDVPYGASSDELLDVFLVGGQNRPVHIFFHGGYWRALHKNDFSFIAPAFRPSDTICVVVNYSLCPAVTISDIVAQCEAATAFIWNNASDFRADRNRITISGHSAGGQIATMLLSTEWSRYGCPPDIIKRAVSISGLYDLEPLRLSFLNDALGLTPNIARALSPLYNLPHTATPLLIALGGAESIEFHRQSNVYVQALAACRHQFEHCVAGNHNHFSIVDTAFDAASHLGAKLHSWVRM